MRNAVCVWGVVAATGCATDPPDQSIARETGASQVVTISGNGPLDLLAFRHEDESDWQAIPTAGNTQFEITVHGPYIVVWGCEVVDEFLTEVRVCALARTLTDDPLIAYSSCSPLRPHRVTGALDEPGRISFAGRGSRVFQPGGSFAFDVRPGIADLAIMRGSVGSGIEALAVRRDIPVTGDIDFGTISLEAENLRPMRKILFTLTNALPDDELSSIAVLTLRGTSLTMITQPDEPPLELTVAPPEVLRASDRHNIFLIANQPRSSLPPFRGFNRTVIAVMPAGQPAPISFELPPLLPDVAFVRTPTAITASYPPLPPHRQVFISRFAESDDFSVFIDQTLEATRAFVQTAPGAISLDLGDIPGFPPAWQIEPTMFENFSFGIDNTIGTLETSAAISEQNML